MAQSRQHSSPISAGLRNHSRAAKQALTGLTATPVSTLLTILSIAIALALPGGVFSILNSISSLSGQWKQGREINIFVDTKASSAHIAQLKKSIAANPDISSIRVITSAQAANELEAESGVDGLGEILGSNALPAVLVITPKDTVQSSEAFEKLAKEIRTKKHVEDVLLDQEWVTQMLGTMKAIKSFAWLVSILFGLTVVLMISTAMRHAVLQKKQEIEVTKLVGGSNPYILRPFIYRSALIGLTSGVLATLLIKVSEMSLHEPLGQLTGLYSQSLKSGLSVDMIISVISIGTLTAIVSAWITVQMELRKIEPR